MTLDSILRLMKDIKSGKIPPGKLTGFPDSVEEDIKSLEALIGLLVEFDFLDFAKKIIRHPVYSRLRRIREMKLYQWSNSEANKIGLVLPNLGDIQPFTYDAEDPNKRDDVRTVCDKLKKIFEERMPIAHYVRVNGEWIRDPEHPILYFWGMLISTYGSAKIAKDYLKASKPGDSFFGSYSEGLKKHGNGHLDLEFKTRVPEPDEPSYDTSGVWVKSIQYDKKPLVAVMPQQGIYVRQNLEKPHLLRFDEHVFLAKKDSGKN